MKFTLVEKVIEDSYYDESEATLMAVRAYMKKKFPHYKEVDCYDCIDGYIVEYDKPIPHDMAVNIDSRMGSKHCKIDCDVNKLHIYNV